MNPPLNIIEAMLAPNIIIIHGGEAFPTVYKGAKTARLRKYYYSISILYNGGMQIIKHPPAIERKGGEINYYHEVSVYYFVFAGLIN